MNLNISSFTDVSASQNDQMTLLFWGEAIAAIILLGFAFAILQRKNKFSFKAFFFMLKDKAENAPLVFWVALGALPPFVRFFIFPMFFGAGNRLHYPINYLPENRPIGHDFLLNIDALENWFYEGLTTSFVYTPVAHVLFAPALLLGYPNSYYALTVLTFVSYLALLILVLLATQQKNHAVIAFIAAITIFSYGLLFEVERGQSYTFTFMILLLSIYIFHKHPDFRFLSYILFSVAIQFKYFPAFFVILFVDDWRDWNTNLKRFLGLGLVNFLLLFLFGYDYYMAFYNQMFAALAYPVVGEGVHSIGSYTAMLQDSGLGMLYGTALSWTRNHIQWVVNMLHLYFAFCFLIVLILAWIRNIKGINFDLLTVLLIGALLLPQSHDYTLPMLGIPFALLLAEWSGRVYPWSKIYTVFLIIITAFTYALMLPPYNVRHIYIKNSLPMLYMILTTVTIMYAAQKNKSCQD